MQDQSLLHAKHGRVPNRLAAVDSLRGLAAVSVLSLHAREVLWIGPRYFWNHYGWRAPLHVWIGYASLPFRFGAIGVMLFFVLSGYCIHRSQLQASLARKQRFRFLPFMRRRVIRLYPTLVAALILTAVCDAYVRARFPTDYKLGDNTLTTFWINVLSLQNIVGPSFGTNGALWSLSVEMHLYMIYPVLLLVAHRIGARAVLWFTLIVSVLSIAIVSLMHWTFLDFLPYWFLWSVGLYVAEIEAGREIAPQWRWGWLAIAAAVLAFPLLLPSSTALTLLADFLLAVPFGVLLAFSLTSRGATWWSGPLGRTLAWLGVFSYSLYATHSPLLVAFRAAFLGGKQSYYAPVAFAGAALCIAAGRLAFELVERWSLQSSQAQRAFAPGLPNAADTRGAVPSDSGPER